ncbi:MAG: hypothetical protein ABIR91_03395 [Candidatus Saccharimonadales bacterium]
MTSNLTITGKPTTKRTANGLILSGAVGKKASKAGNSKRTSSNPKDGKPTLPREHAIGASLHENDPWTIRQEIFSRRGPSGRRPYVSESDGFAVALPTRRDVAAADQARQYRVGDPLVDKFGRRIIHRTPDAWSQRIGR